MVDVILGFILVCLIYYNFMLREKVFYLKENANRMALNLADLGSDLKLLQVKHDKEIKELRGLKS